MRVSMSLIAACAAASFGCGGGATSTGGDAVAEFQQLALDVQAAAGEYQTSMMSARSTDQCRAVHASYDARVRPMVSRMVERSGGMDDFMRAHGGALAADIACTSTRMSTELDDHHALACTSPDPVVNQVEADRHAQAMMSAAGHLQDRCGQMNGVHDAGMFAWGRMMEGCEDWHGGHMGEGMGDAGAHGMMGDAGSGRPMMGDGGSGRMMGDGHTGGMMR